MVIKTKKMKKVLSPEEFNKLPRKEQVVLIAKDVISQIKRSKYKPKEESYITNTILDEGIDKESSIHENFDKIEQCTVCALGAMFLSSCHLKNNITFKQARINNNIYSSIGDFTTNCEVKRLFKSTFSPYQLLLIETAFEGHSEIEESIYNNLGYDGKSVSNKQKIDFVNKLKYKYFNVVQEATRYSEKKFDTVLTVGDAKKCHVFYLKYSSPKSRMVAICKNIISNNGIFKP
jgi:hypothetical protein